MRRFDMTPLYRSSVGFDRFAGLLDAALAGDTTGSSYPPYNIESKSSDSYRITLAVAGFAQEELSIEMRDGKLIIAGMKAQNDDEKNYLHQGIAARGFEKRFALADHVRVEDATLEHGLLHVDLVRELPEALKPRMIDISTPKLAGKKRAKN